MSKGPWLRWPNRVIEIVEILSELARSDRSLQSVMLGRGYSQRDYVGLLRALWRLPTLREEYLSARRVKVAQLTARLLGTSDETLIAMGRKGINQAWHRVQRARPCKDRRADAADFRAQQAQQDPAREVVRRARRRSNRSQV
jgi:hypothetical protein